MMIVLALYGLIAGVFITIFSFVPNMQQSDKLQNIGREHQVSDKIGTVSLSNDRRILFFISSQFKENGTAYKSALYRLDIDSDTLKKVTIDDGNFYTPTTLYINAEDTIFTEIASSTDNGKFIYVYSNMLDLLEKIPIIYDQENVREFVNTGLKKAIALGSPDGYSTYVLTNNNGKSIGTTAAYLNRPLGIPVTTIGATLSFQSSNDEVKDAEARTLNETTTRTGFVA